MFKKVLSVFGAIALVGALSVPANASTTPVLDDEFNGTSVNTSLWNTTWHLGNGAGTDQPDSGNDRTCYKSSHDVESGGVLSLNVTSTPNACKTYAGTKVNYTSGIITSKKSYGYGYYSADIQLPTGTYMWPAWWLFNGYSAGHGEIDIEEAYANTTAYATYHGPNNYNYSEPGRNLGTGFHAYAVSWKKNYLAFYYDGKLVGKPVTKNVPTVNEQLILNLEVGPANSSGQVISNAKVPNSIKVNYIHVYKY